MAYQWNPEDYKQHSSSQLGFAGELIEKLQLRGAERVLDIGCGDGKISAALAALVPDGSVVGIDSSAPMIEYAAASFPRRDYPNLAFVVADASSLPFKQEFDVAFSTAALHWVKDHAPVLAGIYAALKPGGRLLLQMGGAGNAADIIQAADQIIERPEWHDYFGDFPFPYGFYGPDEYEGWTENAGLTVDRAALIPKVVTHATRAELEGWFRTTWLPYLDRLPDAIQPTFINEVIDAYVTDHPADDAGAIRVNMVRLEIAGHKT